MLLGSDMFMGLKIYGNSVGVAIWILLLDGGNGVAPLAGFEPATRCLEGSCSIRLSYRGASVSMN